MYCGCSANPWEYYCMDALGHASDMSTNSSSFSISSLCYFQLPWTKTGHMTCKSHDLILLSDWINKLRQFDRKDGPQLRLNICSLNDSNTLSVSKRTYSPQRAPPPLSLRAYRTLTPPPSLCVPTGHLPHPPSPSALTGHWHDNDGTTLVERFDLTVYEKELYDCWQCWQ